MLKVDYKRFKMTAMLLDEYYFNWINVYLKNGKKDKVFFMGIEEAVDMGDYVQNGIDYNYSGSDRYSENHYLYSDIDYVGFADPEKEKNSKYHDELENK